ncbi:MAG: heavy-metal-associated domain-containing protein [Gemmataceae bacterium]|nr:heavy-metal-associated domain-containing protein [Gemmataceae bacterium]
MTQTKTTINTHGIKCRVCASSARTAVEKLPGVHGVEFDLPGKTVTVTHDAHVDRQSLAQSLTKAGLQSE